MADNTCVEAAEYNAAFVLTEYFGYLRRDPEPEGYDFWLNVLNNGEPGNYRGMVCSFITSTEYQQRFSSVVTHSNAECGTVTRGSRQGQSGRGSMQEEFQPAPADCSCLLPCFLLCHPLSQVVLTRGSHCFCSNTLPKSASRHSLRHKRALNSRTPKLAPRGVRCLQVIVTITIE